MNIGLKAFSTLAILITFFAVGSFAQKASESPALPAGDSDKREEKENKSKENKGKEAVTAEQVAETSIFYYGFGNGFGGGRPLLEQIRKTTTERGRITVTDAQGKTQNVAYQRWILRGEDSFKDRIRFEQDFPNAKYSLIYNNEKIFGIYNNTVFTPDDAALRTFQNQHFRNIDALLRYKENGSKLKLIGREKVLGVEFFVIDLTDKRDQKTRFFISARSFRIMIIEYEENGVKYKRKFYDYRYAQGTLVPYRSVLWADDKVIEESDIGTVTYGQKVDEGLFIEI